MAPEQKEKPKYEVEQVDAETAAKLAKEQDPEGYERDQKMLNALGINLPPEKVAILRGINHPIYAFFEVGTDEETLIKVATPEQVFAAVDKANGVNDGRN